jgi:predicted AAA+ superfamily ATPase
VYPFYSDSRKEYSKQADFFLNDLGIINYFRNNFSFFEFDGDIIENFVYLELIKNKPIFSDEIKTYNKINGSEIDFIYESKMGKILPIEVKLNNKDIIPKIFPFWLVGSILEEIELV